MVLYRQYLDNNVLRNIANHENENQLHLFGESVEENKIREAQEIKQKRPNLFKLLDQKVED